MRVMRTIVRVQAPVYILAGGRSSRFGSDKARARVDGQPLIVRIARSVRSIAPKVTVVAARAGAYDDLGLPTIGDLHPGCGPLAGLQTALKDCDAPWLLMLSCDLLDVQPAWIDRLLRMRTDTAAAVAYRHQYWEPLIALYHQRINPEVERRLASRQLRMQALLEAVPSIAVELPSGWPTLPQANTPADLDPMRRQRP